MKKYEGAWLTEKQKLINYAKEKFDKNPNGKLIVYFGSVKKLNLTIQTQEEGDDWDDYIENQATSYFVEFRLKGLDNIEDLEHFLENFDQELFLRNFPRELLYKLYDLAIQKIFFVDELKERFMIDA